MCTPKQFCSGTNVLEAAVSLFAQQASVVQHAVRLGHRMFSRKCNVHGAALICTQSVVAEGDGLRLSWRMKERGCTATNAAKGSWYCAVVVVSMRLCVSNVSFIYRVAR